MNPYRPDINTDAHGLAWLQDRAAYLRRILSGGSKSQRGCAGASAELAAINRALKARANEPEGQRPKPKFVAPLPALPAVPAGPYTAVLLGVCPAASMPR